MIIKFQSPCHKQGCQPVLKVGTFQMRRIDVLPPVNCYLCPQQMPHTSPWVTAVGNSCGQAPPWGFPLQHPLPKHPCKHTHPLSQVQRFQKQYTWEQGQLTLAYETTKWHTWLAGTSPASSTKADHSWRVYPVVQNDLLAIILRGKGTWNCWLCFLVWAKCHLKCFWICMFIAGTFITLKVSPTPYRKGLFLPTLL